MHNSIDLTKILRDCPKGTNLYTTVWGEVTFNRIVDEKPLYPILIETDIAYVSLTKEGHYTNKIDADCILFPSREQRDWSKFNAPWYKKRVIEPKFKVGDKIVNSIRKYMNTLGTQGIISEITDNKYIFTDGSHIFISNQDDWELASNKKSKFDPKTFHQFDKVLVRDAQDEEWCCDFFSHISDDSVYPYEAVSAYYTFCIPYNDETKHLVGTKGEAPEYYRYWED